MLEPPEVERFSPLLEVSELAFLYPQRRTCLKMLIPFRYYRKTSIGLIFKN